MDTEELSTERILEEAIKLDDDLSYQQHIQKKLCNQGDELGTLLAVGLEQYKRNRQQLADL